MATRPIPYESLAPAVDPVAYLRSLGLEPFEWQVEALKPADRLLLLCARQSGKTTIVAGKAGHRVRYSRNSENLIVCPAQDQSKQVMQRFEEFTLLDRSLPSPEIDSVFEKFWRAKRNRVLALPGSERSVRGYSDPDIIIADEAARIDDGTYIAFRPWMTGGKSQLIAMTTPYGKRGWFHKAWESSRRWKKILVRVRWDVHNGRLIDAMPEDEFRDYWAQKGVLAYYSPRHTRAWCEEELEENGEWAFRQEYCCEFMDLNDQWISDADIRAAFVDDEEPIETPDDIFADEEAITI